MTTETRAAKSESPLLSIIVAAYNEGPVIEANVGRIVETLETRGDVSWELILVDDGSADDTGRLMDEAAGGDERIVVLHHWRNFGQGRALRIGFEAARGDYAVTLDADLSYRPEYIWKLYDAILQKKVEIVLASPYTRGGTVSNVPFYRLFLSRWGNRYLARMSHYDITTSTCVVRIYRREVLDTLVLTSDGMELQLEILMKSAITGFRVAEIPADLAWDTDKAQDAAFRRASKMKILRSIRLYLQMGWLSQPAFGIIVLALLMLLPGLYMAAWQVFRICQFAIAHLSMGSGLRWAISNGLEKAFTLRPVSFAVSGLLIVIGLQLGLFALIFIQNKFYYDELYKLGQRLVQRDRSR